ncbi:hypothetical protein FHS39_000876 [Streptomyces olivoverticillatus]|uniref:Uncharacterized protein n=1 Tax=Streptomyces olivoverticillatus TaxID=66427 RepID=A0A7W7PIB7_9ACTN|nr:hypothetical protein [Streptomyces olivoverticillatus]MBB4891876.1 hypothetical protein [Streptomyces olivoverticillatus]
MKFSIQDGSPLEGVLTCDEAELGAPNHFPGRVFISSDHSFQPGVSLEVPGKERRVSYDPSSGWIAIRLKDAVDAEFVQIASGIVLGIDTGDLVSIWLDPVFVEWQTMRRTGKR